MRSFLSRCLVWVTLVFASVTTSAEDIDIYTSTSLGTNALPNVILLVDNTANWSSKFTVEMQALASTLNGLAVGKFRVGIMLYTETGTSQAAPVLDEAPGGNGNGNGGGNSGGGSSGGGSSGGGSTGGSTGDSSNSGDDGGYVRAAVRTMTSDNKTKYQALVNSLDVTNDKSNGGKASLLMAEAYRYFAGGAPYAGSNKAKTDYTGNTFGTTASTAIYGLTGNALSSKAGTAYTAPTGDSPCGNNYIIYISNGNPAENTSDLSTAASMLTSAGGDATTITLPSGWDTASKDSKFDEWAKFMKSGSSLGITTYTVDVDRVTTGQGPAWTGQLKSAASVSGGKYFDVSSSSGTSGAAIADALKKIFDEIQAVNSAFASASLPVSANTQGSYINQVFIGQFRPADNGAPRWWGNLKQYKIGVSNGELYLIDASGAGAVDTTTGFIKGCAKSYWTLDSKDWNNAGLKSHCSTGSVISDAPDGYLVEKGAQAQKLRGMVIDSSGSIPRALKACSDTWCSSLVAFNTTNVSASTLGVTSSEQASVINWVLGQDVQDEDLSGATGTSANRQIRRSVHGDVVHSRPLAFNYGTDASPKIVVFYGGNDGLLRAINGNQTGTTAYSDGGTSYTAGQELWSFAPSEFMTKFKRLYDNSPRVAISGVTDTSATRKDYGMDGPISIHRASGTATLVAGMRRGGRSLYAFNVTDPSSPTMAWRVGCTEGGSCSTDLSGIGQTWGTPSVVTWRGSTTATVLMGGGYDTCEDSDPHTCTSSSKGRAVYILSLADGSVLKKLDTDRSVVGDIATVVNTLGKVVLAYATDLGGNIYRIVPNEAGNDWTITKIASLGCDSPTTGCTANRKFLFGPDVIAGKNGIYYILAGSGDREKPLLTYTSAASVSNFMFMVRDKPTDTTWLTSQNSTCGGNYMCKSSLLSVAVDGATPTEDELNAKRGWYLALRSTEQVVTSAITSSGVTTFSTHTPPTTSASSSCSPSLGIARVYNVRFRTSAPIGTTRSEVITGGGLPPSPVAGKVSIDGQIYDFVIGADSSSSLEIRKRTSVTSTVTAPKVRVYQYTER